MILIKEARTNMDLNALSRYYGKNSYNIKIYMELEEVEMSKKDIEALDDLDVPVREF